MIHWPKHLLVTQVNNAQQLIALWLRLEKDNLMVKIGLPIFDNQLTRADQNDDHLLKVLFLFIFSKS